MFNFLLLISAIVLITLDYVYLKVMKVYFENQVKMVQGKDLKMNYLSAIICYIFLITGLNYFIIRPNKTTSDAFLLGMLLYGVSETTNYAIFTNWSLLTVIIDTLWGGVLFASTTYISSILRIYL